MLFRSESLISTDLSPSCQILVDAKNLTLFMPARVRVTVVAAVERNVKFVFHLN